MRSTSVAPEHRLTVSQIEELTRLAARMSIRVKAVQQEKTIGLEISGEGFSAPGGVTLPLSVAYVRLLAEVCSGLAPWVPFSTSEPCETTLFGLGQEKLDVYVKKYQRRLALRLAARRREERRAKRRLFASVPQMAAAAAN